MPITDTDYIALVRVCADDIERGAYPDDVLTSPYGPASIIVSSGLSLDAFSSAVEALLHARVHNKYSRTWRPQRLPS